MAKTILLWTVFVDSFRFFCPPEIAGTVKEKYGPSFLGREGPDGPGEIYFLRIIVHVAGRVAAFVSCQYKILIKKQDDG